MAKSERMAFILVSGLLLVLMLVLIVRSTINSNAARVYRISFITDDVSGDYSQNIRKGLERAARDYNVDLQMISLHGDMSTDQQRASFEREISMGAEAVILHLQRSTDLAEELDFSSLSVPVVSLGSAWSGIASSHSVSSDDAAMGRMLGEQMLNDGVDAVRIRSSVQNSRIRLREEGLTEVLDAANVPHSSEADASSAAWVDLPTGAAVAALDTPAIEKLIRGSRSGQIALYGVGYTNALLFELETGSIRSLIVEDDFALGYLALRNAVEALGSGSAEKERILSSYAADGENLYEEPLRHVLFPIF